MLRRWFMFRPNGLINVSHVIKLVIYLWSDHHAKDARWFLSVSNLSLIKKSGSNLFYFACLLVVKH